MGIFARRQRYDDVCGLGLCGYCGASTATAGEIRYRTLPHVVRLTGERQDTFLLQRYRPDMWLNIGLLDSHFV
jgi:hypothetical protein